MDKEKILELISKKTWKNENKKYLFEVQKFLDLCDNIKDENLKKIIIYQMLNCDKSLTLLAEDTFRLLMSEKEE